MFVFDNLADLGDRELQALLREVPNDRLGLALRGADAKVKEKITRNMSQRAAQILLEDMEARGPVRLSEVEAEQKRRVKAGEQPLTDDETRQMWLGYRAKHQIYPADDPGVIGYEEQTTFVRERSDEAIAEGRLDALDRADSGGGFESNRRKH